MVWQKPKTGRSAGYHPYSNEDMKRVSWCMDNAIKIAVIPSGTKWQVELSLNKKIHLDNNEYEAGEAYKKMYEYYKYYYDKHNK
tara:strand:+ start:700 stop:951 length:252 start_codon:yes stop_codon:yes gene_type:complete